MMAIKRENQALMDRNRRLVAEAAQREASFAKSARRWQSSFNLLRRELDHCVAAGISTSFAVDGTETDECKSILGESRWLERVVPKLEHANSFDSSHSHPVAENPDVGSITGALLYRGDRRRGEVVFSEAGAEENKVDGEEGEKKGEVGGNAQRHLLAIATIHACLPVHVATSAHN